MMENMDSAPEEEDVLLWSSWSDSDGFRPPCWAVGRKWKVGGWHVVGNTMSLRFHPIMWTRLPEPPR